jgi:hypothetical protein
MSAALLAAMRGAVIWPDDDAARTADLVARLHAELQAGRLGEILLDAPLLHDRVPARHRPATPVGREAAPKQQRQHHAKGPGEHEDDPDRVDAEP